jgi:hypothetical protein
MFIPPRQKTTSQKAQSGKHHAAPEIHLLVAAIYAPTVPKMVKRAQLISAHQCFKTAWMNDHTSLTMLAIVPLAPPLHLWIPNPLLLYPRFMSRWSRPSHRIYTNFSTVPAGTSSF